MIAYVDIPKENYTELMVLEIVESAELYSDEVDDNCVRLQGEIAPLCHWLGRHDYPITGVKTRQYRAVTLILQELEGFTRDKLERWLEDMIDLELGCTCSPFGEWLEYDGYHISD